MNGIFLFLFILGFYAFLVIRIADSTHLSLDESSIAITIGVILLASATSSLISSLWNVVTRPYRPITQATKETPFQIVIKGLFALLKLVLVISAMILVANFIFSMIKRLP